MSRWVLPAVMFGVALLVGCSSGNNNRPATPTRSAATPQAAVASPQARTPAAASTPAAPEATPAATRTPSTPAAGTPAPQASAPAPAPSPASQDQAAVTRLSQVGLTSTDLPQQMLLTAKRQLSNDDYASGQADPAAYAKMLSDAGRINGAYIQYQYAGVATPPPDAPVLLGLLEILSAWQSEDAAKAGLQSTMKDVTTGGQQSSNVQQTSEPVDLSSIPDVLQATHLHITSLIPGQVNSDVYVLGLQHGTDTALIIVSGQNGVPTLDQAKQLADTQSRKLRGG